MKLVIDVPDGYRPEFWKKSEERFWLFELMAGHLGGGQVVAIIKDSDWSQIAELIERIAEEEA